MAKDKSAEQLPPSDDDFVPLPIPAPAGEDDDFKPLPPPEVILAEQPAAEEAPAEESVDPAAQMKLDNTLLDMGAGLFGGLFKAADSSNNMVASGIDALKGVAGDVAKTFNPKNAEAIDQWANDSSMADGMRKRTEEFKRDPARQLFFTPETTAGHVTSSVSQFAVGMIGAGKILKGAQLLQGGGKAMAVARGMTTGAIADATVFDHEERLSDLVESYPSLSNPITEYLSADPTDSVAEDRFKSVIEGAMAAGAVESLVVAVRGIRAMRSARKTGGLEAANEVAAKVGDELEALQKQAEAPKLEIPSGAADTAASPRVDTGASAVSAAAEVLQSKGAIGKVTPLKGHKLTSNVKPPVQDIKDYMVERLEKGSVFDPGYSRDFNLAKQSTTDGAKQVINLMSDALAPEIDKLKGGVQTFAHIERLAHIAGERPEVLMARMSSRAADAKRMASDVVATEEWMLSMARSISEEARRLDNGVSANADLLNQMMDSMSAVVGDLKAVKTAAARTTGAGRLMKGDRFSMEQVKALVAAGGDIEKVAKLVDPPSRFRRALNAHTEYWINALLSGPKTHVVNMTSNLLNTFARPTEKILGGQVREGLSEFMGMAKGLKDSISMMARAWKLEESILDPNLTKVDAPRFAISAKAAGLSPNSTMGAMVDWAGKVIRLPTRALMAQDEFFKQLNYRSNVYAKATREGVEKGLDGPKLADYVESRFESAFDGTGKGMDDASLREAQIATFTEDLAQNSIGQTILNATHKHPGLRLILPFVRTPTNIIKQLGHRTPGVNLFMKSYREELKAGGARAAAARGKWATGGALWGSGLLLASEGRISGRGPSDHDERATLLATGWRPYSVKVGDTYYEYGRLDPYGMALGLAADFTEARGYMSDADAEDIALAMGAALARNLSSKTYLRGVTETLDALSQPDQKFQRWFQSRVGSYVPSGTQQVAGLIGQGDDSMREVRSALDAVMARTPGLSDNLPPKRNILGEPIRYPPGLGPDSISPFVASKDLADPVKAELARLSYGFKLPSEKINEGRIDLTKYKNAKGQDAYDRLLELRTIERKGRYTLKERLESEITSDRYQKLPDGNDEYSSKKLERVRLIIGEYQEQTMKRLRREYPVLDRDLTTDSNNMKNVQRKGVGALAPLLGQQP